MNGPRLFVSPEQLEHETVRIVGPDHLHLARVLRARPRDPILLLDNCGNAFQAVLVSVEKTETVARKVAPASVPPEPTLYISVAQALGKGDKLEQVIQHGVEVGASAFLPVYADRSVVALPPDRVAERLARWRQIAKGAAEQCGRARIPDVRAPERLLDLLASPHGCSACLLCHTASENAVSLHSALAALPRPGRLLLAIGPEGGWSPAEVDAACAAGAVIVSLGPRILRTETAALAAISQILYHYERT